MSFPKRTSQAREFEAVGRSDGSVQKSIDKVFDRVGAFTWEKYKEENDDEENDDENYQEFEEIKEETNRREREFEEIKK